MLDIDTCLIFYPEDFLLSVLLRESLTHSTHELAFLSSHADSRTDPHP